MTLFVVGLGNPGRTNNRHNVGHRVIDCMLRILRPNDHFFADNIEVRAHKTDVLMNVSGPCVKKVLKGSDKLWVVHDDLEVPLGMVKWKYGGSASGHNGLRSINATCGVDYGRIRVGIGRPPEGVPVSQFVTTDHAPDELALISSTEERLARFVIDNIPIMHAADLPSLRQKYKAVCHNPHSASSKC